METKEFDDANRMYKETKTLSIEDISNFENREVPTKQTSQTKYNNPGAKSIELVQFTCLQKHYTLQKGDIVPIREETNFSQKNISRKVEDLKDKTAEVNRSRQQKQNDTESKYGISGSEKHLDASDCIKNTPPIVKLHRQSDSKSRHFQVFIDPSYILILISLSSATVVRTYDNVHCDRGRL